MSEEANESLEQQVARAPTGPGCYLWKDGAGEVLYVGKAVKLRNRLRNYLGSYLHVRTYHLMRAARGLEWIRTNTEAEALILEANLVKKYNPRYNVRLKDDKRYPYICVSTSEPYPMVFLTRKVQRNGNRYFGPYTDVRAARNLLALIHKIFPIRKTPQKLPLKKPGRPCMNFHIKRCLGPCRGDVPEEEYRKLVDEILLFLEGRREILENIVTRRMREYSERQSYERAALYRDMLVSIRKLNERQSVMSQAGRDIDVLGVALERGQGQIALMEVREGRLLGRKSFPLAGMDEVRARAQEVGAETIEPGEGSHESGPAPTAAAESQEALIEEILVSFLRDYYVQPDTFVPARIVLPAKIKAKKLLTAVLSEKAERTVRLTHSRTPATAPLIDLARKNADLLLKERILATRFRDRQKGLEQLAEMLSLKEAPAVIECYDISHFQGAEPVGSGVLFVDGLPHKAGYRTYRIKSKEGIDDPAMMQEVIARRIQRLQNENRALPDLIVIDGGFTQLSAACEAAAALDAGELPMIGLAKQREEIYLPGKNVPLQFDKNSPALKLLRHARDEAHRFGVSFHRRRRNKHLLKHVLDEIPDIGPGRKSALLKQLVDRKIEEASLEEIQATPGFGPALAAKVHAFIQERAQKIAAEPAGQGP